MPPVAKRRGGPGACQHVLGLVQAGASQEQRSQSDEAAAGAHSGLTPRRGTTKLPAFDVVTLFDEYQSKENAKHTLRALKENARQGFWNGSLPPIAVAFAGHMATAGTISARWRSASRWRRGGAHHGLALGPAPNPCRGRRERGYGGRAQLCSEVAGGRDSNHAPIPLKLRVFSRNQNSTPTFTPTLLRSVL